MFYVSTQQARAGWLVLNVLLGLLLTQPVAGQVAQRTLTLPQAVQGAVTQSKAIRLNTAEQGVAQAKLEQARNERLPGVSINASYIRISDNVTPFSVQFPGAGDIILNPQILNQSYNNVQVRQLLWSGGVVRKGIAAASREAEAVQAEANQYRLSAADNVISLWANLYLLNASERIIRQNINLLRAQRRDLANLEEQGLVLKNDGLKLELAVSNLETSLVDIQAGRNITNFNLATVLAEAPDTEYLIDSTAITFPPETAPVADYLVEAIKNRPELSALNLRREAALIGQQIVAASRRMPTLSVSGSYDYNRPNLRVFPQQPAFKGTWSVGLFLSYDIEKLYTNRARETESRFGLDRFATGIDQARDGISMEVNAMYQSYQQALAKISLATKAIDQATENFRVEQNRLQAAATTPTDFLEANTQLVQAKLNRETARANAELARWKLLKSVGRLPN